MSRKQLRSTNCGGDTMLLSLLDERDALETEVKRLRAEIAVPVRHLVSTSVVDEVIRERDEARALLRTITKSGYYQIDHSRACGCYYHESCNCGLDVWYEAVLAVLGDDKT